jgi:hypothetical protein
VPGNSSPTPVSLPVSNKCCPLRDPPACHTAAFKKSASPDVSKAVGPLLKAYQEEIDRLTSRAKAGEAAFLDVYQKLYEAPNPAPALSAGLVSKGMLQNTEYFTDEVQFASCWSASSGV